MSILDNYQREEVRRLQPGDYRCVIAGAIEKQSKTGKGMIEITVVPNGTDIKVKDFIVEGAYFNKRMTEIFDAFPTIGEGNKNLLEWVGAMGAAHFIEDDKGYLRVHYYINPAKAEKLAEWQGELPRQQKVVNLFPSDNDAPPAGDEVLPDDLPF